MSVDFDGQNQKITSAVIATTTTCSGVLYITTDEAMAAQRIPTICRWKALNPKIYSSHSRNQQER